MVWAMGVLRKSWEVADDDGVAVAAGLPLDAK
jgi:hypothetical protein